MSQKNEVESNVFYIKQKQINEKEHNIEDQQLYPQGDQNMTCWQKFKNALNNFVNRTIDFFEYDRVFNADGAPKIDMKKCYKRFLENYDETYSQRQIRFAFSFDYVLQQKIKEQKRKQKDFWTQLYRFVCCEGGNQMQEIDESYKSERQYQEIVKRKLLEKKEEFEQMMKKQEEEEKEKEKEIQIQKEKEKEKERQKLEELMKSDPFILEIYDEQQNKKEVSKTKHSTQTVVINTKILKINQTQQHINIKKNRKETIQDEDSSRTHKKGVNGIKKSIEENQYVFDSKESNPQNKINEKDQQIEKNVKNKKNEKIFHNSSTNFRQNTESSLFPHQNQEQNNTFSDMVEFDDYTLQKNRKQQVPYQPQDEFSGKITSKKQNKGIIKQQPISNSNKNNKEHQDYQWSNNNKNLQKQPPIKNNRGKFQNEETENYQQQNIINKNSYQTKNIYKANEVKQISRNNVYGQTSVNKDSNKIQNKDKTYPNNFNAEARNQRSIERQQEREIERKAEKNKEKQAKNQEQRQGLSMQQTNKKIRKNNGQFQQVQQITNPSSPKKPQNFSNNFQNNQNTRQDERVEPQNLQRNKFDTSIGGQQTNKKQYTNQENSPQYSKKSPQKLKQPEYITQHKHQTFLTSGPEVTNLLGEPSNQKQPEYISRDPENKIKQQSNNLASDQYIKSKSPQKQSTKNKNNDTLNEAQDPKQTNSFRNKNIDSQFVFDNYEDIPEQRIDSSVQLQSKKRKNKKRNNNQLEDEPHDDSQRMGQPKISNNKSMNITVEESQDNIGYTTSAIMGSKKTKKAKQVRNNLQDDQFEINLNEKEDNNVSNSVAHSDKVQVEQQQAHKKRKNKKMVRNEENMQDEINLEDFNLQSHNRTQNLHSTPNTGEVQQQSIVQASKKRRNKKQLRAKEDDMNVEEVVFDAIDEVNIIQEKKEEHVPADSLVKAQKKRKRAKLRKEDEGNNEEQIIEINF